MRALAITALILSTVCCLLTPPARAADGDYTTGLVGHWKLDETTGTTADDAVSTNDGTMTGGLSGANNSVAGVDNSALNFDGADDQVTMGDVHDLIGSPFTLSAWVKPDSLAAYAPIINKLSSTPGQYGNYRLILADTAGNVQFLIKNSSNANEWLDTANNPLKPGKWTHVAVTYNNSTTAVIYIDGQFNTQKTNFTIARGNTSWPLELGKNTNNGVYFDGAVDDARIYNRVWTANDIKALYVRSAKFCDTPTGAPGEIRYNADRAIMQYCDGHNWVTMGLGSYLPSAIYFNSASWLTRGGDLTGLTDGKKVTGSFWLRTEDLTTNGVILYSSGNGSGFRVRHRGIGNGADVDVFATNAAGAMVLYINSQNSLIADNKWHHALFSVDLEDGANRSHFYIDGAQKMGSGNTFVNDAMDFTQSEHMIGDGESQDFYGDLADTWIDFGTYIDFSSAALREKFRSPTGMPMYLGEDGSLPTGATPDIFLSGDLAGWPTNKGTGGGFTMNGALEYSSTQIGYTSAADLNSGLVGWWKLDESGNTNTAADSAGSVTGTLTGFPADESANWGPGKFGNRLEFDGTDDYITLGNPAALRLTGSMTISVWIRGDSFPAADHDIVSKAGNVGSRGYVLRIDGTEVAGPTGQVECIVAPDGSTMTTRSTGEKINPGAWHHIACVYNAAALTLDTYVDGVLDSDNLNGAVPPSQFNPAINANIGRRPNNGAYFDGIIDDVRIYNRALSAGEIQILARGSCSSPNGVGGSMIYNTDHKVLQYCNGRDWVAMSRIGGTGGAGCASPAGTAGTLRFSSNDGVMQYCNSQDWVNIGKGADVSSTGLLLRWKHDENAGTSATDSAGSNTGAMAGGLSAANNAVAGRKGLALDYDGADDYTTHSLDIPKSKGAIAHWLKPAQIRDMVAMYESSCTGSNCDGFGASSNVLEIHTGIFGGKWHALYEDGGNAAAMRQSFVDGQGPNAVAGEWAHIVITWDTSDYLKLYVNGALIGMDPMYDNVFLGNTPSVRQFGRVGNGAAARHWDGLVDDLRVYDRVLSAAEVMQLYNVTK